MAGAEDNPLRECPDHPGWREWHVPGAFNRDFIGLLLVRDDGGDVARTRIFPGKHMANAYGSLHGGVISAFADASLFAGAGLLSEEHPSAAVTIDLSVQFTGSGNLEEPLDGLVTVLRETRRMVFVQGRIEQGGNTIAGFSGVLRKITG